LAVGVALFMYAIYTLFKGEVKRGLRSLTGNSFGLIGTCLDIV